MKKKVSIVICVYNEEKTIVNVVQSCHKYNKDAEIIVVDDGSNDRTSKLLADLEQEIPFIHIRFPENTGKSNAMAVGVENASNEIILFFDSDVSGIKQEHFEKLLSPLMDEKPEADMVVGSPSETLINYRINPFKSLTGERALFKKDILPILENIRDIRFGVETYINLYYQAHGRKIKYIILEGLIHPSRYGKAPMAQATMEYINEGQEIAQALMKNYDLIIKRISNTFEERSEKIKETYKRIQTDLNEKIRVLLRNNG